MPYDPQKHHRRSIRLKGYDYAQPGAYFVTMVTHQRQDLFGDIVDDEMVLSPLGKIVRYEWLRSINIRKEILLHDDEFVVMPNHFHDIVWIVDVRADGVRPGEDHPISSATLHPPNHLIHETHISV
jgi:REP-associated tyrosine transposase